MFAGKASPLFLDSSGIWWQDPASMAAGEASWDVPEVAAPQRAADDDSDHSHPEEDSVEELGVQDPPIAAAQGGEWVFARCCLHELWFEFQELEAIKARVREMEEEDKRLKELQLEAESCLLMGSEAGLFQRMTEGKVEADQRSIYVGNVSEGCGTGPSLLLIVWQVCAMIPSKGTWPLPCKRLAAPKPHGTRGLWLQVDYGGTAEELESHFNICGRINRVTILCDKFSGHPKGYAYIEFEQKSSVKAAVELDESIFRGRVIKVLPKRTNMPGISSTDRGGRWGRFQARGGLIPRWGYYGGQPVRLRGRTYRTSG
ncbi:hypothetical protein CIB84_008080 [Bambusicola thoracicus]|uniref:RRM domain-containing protein n=1 Tax=Bambusicola thoracicus TaxID=9083 RepID=A0A2P4SVP5_BAMTH|nr:hypothetical protein CIB84_008080 [Bambusicola thoracicus]